MFDKMLCAVAVSVYILRQLGGIKPEAKAATRNHMAAEKIWKKGK